MEKGGGRSKAKPWEGKRLTQEKPKVKAATLIPQRENGLPYLSFSFRYVAQQEFFGIGGEDASWFANLQDRLRDLSGKTGAIVDNEAMRKAYRLHPIDWKAKNCPITADDLRSVPDVIKQNNTEDFFWQFQLSKGTGRVVGFFNEEHSIFYIVLLDPKHNIQPSKDYGYALTPTHEAVTEYERVRMQISEMEKVRLKCSKADECPMRDLLATEYFAKDMMYISMEEELVEMYSQMVEAGSLKDDFETFLMEKYLGK